MKSTVESVMYRLIQPGVIEEVSTEWNIPKGWAAVKPKLASICHADLRYFSGKRRPEALAKKLPMALLHEGIAVVEESNAPEFSAGDRVVIVPNIPGAVLHPEIEQKSEVPVNYTKGNSFLGSGYDGIAQSMLVHPAECLVKIPDEIPDEVAVLAELSTVSFHAISHIRSKLLDKTKKIALFGDGPVGYFTASMIRYMYEVEKERFVVFGADEQKLAEFDFAQTENVTTYDFENSEMCFDILLECTGGAFSENALNQAIDIADSCADVILMGVTEARVPINTRDILEKGLTLHGSSRSSTADFQAVIEGMKNLSYQEALKRILPVKMDDVSNGAEFKEVMDRVAANHGWKKTVINFKWE
ncbi:alcohol dehydrogenase catalytic domain-containing protein [Enterococcus sp. BWB1-3]|uniref:alcohol dehydrogenase catalytic domain-containing protein n=1 Tax=unclassified Enterococcus TaxID=2608891 RepID=UPI0019218B74|nr:MULTISPECIES: alcohol dehydrogenase catalytic domain-containing protein [unclassified Enterococcus]MBL1230421.1 alcohol dehydrogenase catalytic domain-containing protein [Enterococcus sp. BWB1-3]MCB5952319.1 alcohol dehydrogenase catalytic domain-containing protein [Enterococcus sp. BWT-B8]MCB5955711.1 alcohol dehydrogenase catalytic domain-containing protein [Enterococcus sp. CWB-B31]